jgi:hypothetical protein
VERFQRLCKATTARQFLQVLTLHLTFEKQYLCLAMMLTEALLVLVLAERQVI